MNVKPFWDAEVGRYMLTLRTGLCDKRTVKRTHEVDEGRLLTSFGGKKTCTGDLFVLVKK